jgi:hypothetical protein
LNRQRRNNAPPLMPSIRNQEGMRRMKRIMYIENKENGLSGQARIGWVELSRSIVFRSARFNSRSH